MDKGRIKLSVCLSILCLVLFFIGIACVGVITVSALRLFFVNQTTASRLLTDFLLSPGSPVLLNYHRFDSIAGVQISTNSDNPTDDFNVKFFKGRCDSLQYKTTAFPDTSRDLKPFADTRVAVNYFYADFPLYVAGGNSTITYWLSSTNGHESAATDDDCQLELYSFSDKSDYIKFLNSPTSLPAEGYMNKSGCLPVGRKDNSMNSTVVFSLTEPNSYFFAISSAQDILTHIIISVQALEFDTKKLKLLDCVLNSFITSCKVSLDNTNEAYSPVMVTTSCSDVCDRDRICIWAKASHYVSINVTSIKKNQPGKDNSYIYDYCVAGSALLLVICVCAINSITVYQMCFLFRPRRKHHPAQWQDVVKNVHTGKSDEKKPLLSDHVDNKKGTIQF